MKVTSNPSRREQNTFKKRIPGTCLAILSHRGLRALCETPKSDLQMWSTVFGPWAGDYRLDGWAFMSNPVPTVLVSLAYIYFVKVAGPRFMEHREPFKLRGAMIVYNFLAMALNAKIFYNAATSGWLNGHYSWRCAEIDRDVNEMTSSMVVAAWLFYFSKIVELADTVFFVLRKKWSQITLLHVVHHSLLPVSCWFAVKYVPVGHASFMGFTNSFVHILMYSYYALAACGPRVARYLWWKRYLTRIQMTQFVAMFVHSVQVIPDV